MKLSARKQVLLALAGALVIHVVLILSVSVATMYWPSTPLEGVSPPSPIRLTIEREEPTPEPQLVPGAKPTPPPYAATLDRQRSDRPPDEAFFQSDKDTQAASEMPPQSDDRSMPSQAGRETPHFAFDTQDYMAGDKANDSAGQNAASAPPAPPPEPIDPPPRPQPDRTAAATPKARATPAPASTPPPPRPDISEFAMLAPAPSPSPSPSPDLVDPSQVNPPKPEPILSLARPRAQAPLPPPTNPGAPGYRTQTIKSIAKGGITNQGVSSVAARDTPLGRYMKDLGTAIGSLWNMRIRDNVDKAQAGFVKIRFVVGPNGKVRGVKVLEGNQNSIFSSICIEAITESKVPPLPPELAAALPNNELETEYSFAFIQ